MNSRWIILFGLGFCIQCLGQDATKMSMWNHMTAGDQHFQNGDLALAEIQYKQAYSLLDTVLEEGKSHRISIFNETVYDAMDRLGYLYFNANNLTKASSYFSQSRELRDRNLPKRSIFRIPPLVGLAEVHMALNEPEKAKELLALAERLYNRSTTGWYNSDPYGKTIFSLQFELALKEKRYRDASRYLNKLSVGGGAMSIDKNVQAAIPKVFDMRARYFLHTDDYEQAVYNLDKAEKFAKSLAIQQVIFQVEKTKALLKWSQNDIQGAAKSFSVLIDGYKKYVVENFAAMSEYEREQFFEKLRVDFDLFNAFSIQNADQPMAGSLFETVYDNQLFSKAILLNHINKQKELILSSGNEELISLLRNWEEQKALLSSLHFQKKVSPLLIEQAETRIFNLEREINSKSDFLKKAHEEVTWQEVRNALGEKEVAVEIIRVRNFELKSESADKPDFSFGNRYSYLAMLVSSNSSNPEFFIIPDAEDKEGKFLNFYRNSIRHKLEDNSSYDIYWKPIQTHIVGFSKVFLSADGAYNQVNLHSLRNPKTGEYVLDETHLIMVTNTKDLVQRPAVQKEKSAVLFGRPQYLLSGQNAGIGEKGLISELRSFDSETFSDFREQIFVDLPETENEVRKIANLLSERLWEVQSNYGSDASEARLKASQNPGILHIATHGFFLPENNTDGVNSMIRSGIILAGVDRVNVESADDGVLTAYEATNLSLEGTHLVVLSACETGLGEIKNGEGVYGLQRGFSVAGARHLLMSLWKVDDFATQQLMTSFYENWLGGMEIHLAFEQAQHDLRVEFPHPFYWGAFLLLGN